MRGLWDLDPSVRHLNHGSFGACPRAVLEKQAQIRAEIERDTMGFYVNAFQPRLDAAREVLGAFLGASPQSLAFVSNATTAVNAVLRGYRFEAGDEILTLEQGYPACHNAAEFVAERWGARVVYVVVPIPVNSADEWVDRVMERVTDRTRLALLDHIASPTGLIVPIAALIGKLKARGVRTLIDGAHAPGAVPLDLDTLGADWYTGNAHKWLCSPKGAAFLYASETVREQTRPLVISHGARAPLRGRSRFHLEFDWTGTRDPSAWFSVPSAIEVVGDAVPGGWPEVMRRNAQMAHYGMMRVADAVGGEPVGPASMMPSMAALVLPARFGEPESPFCGQHLAGWLRSQGFVNQVVAWPQRRRWILRLSAHLYNVTTDYIELAETLRDGLGDRPWIPADEIC